MQPQKVLHYKDAMKKKNPKVSGEYIVTEKLDGNYVYVDYSEHTENWYALCSSSCRALPALNHIDMEDFGIRPHRSYRFIFEATHPDHDFYGLNGLLNRHSPVDGIVLNLHDAIPLNNLLLPAKERIKLLKELLPDTLELSKGKLRMQHVPYFGTHSNHSSFQRIFEEVVERGGEGICMKHVDGLYYPGKRNETLLKMKQDVSLDLLVVKLIPSIGKKGEYSLSLLCQRKDGTEITVVVPKDKDRDAWTADPSLVLGTVVEVKAMKELENGMLREPRLYCQRLDKSADQID